ncbi:MAG TPA: hypothetical protein EYP78_00390 [Candidatus Omnitrophica bacterium]|nr:hypothetical protein [Candidatus Omnitrophota bacterium]
MPLERFWEKLIDKIESVDKRELREYIGALLKERVLLENIFNALTEGVLVLDSNNKAVYINKRLNELIDIDPKNLPESLSYYNSRLAHLILEERNEVRDEEIEIIEPQRRLLKVSKLSLSFPKEKSLGTVVIIDDITEERRLQEEKSHGERFATLTQLTAGLAHEIGNPLNSLQIHLELLNKEIRKLPHQLQEKFLEFVKVIKEEIATLDRIVKQFLVASRPSPLKLEEVRIEEVIRQLIRLLSPELEKNRIEVEEHYTAYVPPILMDASQIREALLNIFKNSIEAMPNGGKIYVSTLIKGGRLEIKIADEGTGIPENILYRIFNPYFTTKEKGSGLGLMITYRIIKAHAGDIKVKSKPGEGTQIIVAIPIKRSKVPLPVHFPSEPLYLPSRLSLKGKKG